MSDSNKFTAFLKIAPDKLGMVKSGLLRHEKNPTDREFINDILRSVRSLKNASLTEGLGRISELCFHLESMLDLIRRNRIPINREIVDIITAGRDRLKKLVHEVETMQIERATIKDLVKRIKTFEDSCAEEQTLDTAPALEIFQAEETPPEEEEPDLSLLPDEIKNEEYDKELFQIFIDQMQENLSLLRALTDDYPRAANKGKTLAICSELVGKLQTSANYMGYEELAAFYLQWIAELEMSGVDLAMGSGISFDFMDANIRKIAGLFPQIQDIAADKAAVTKTMSEYVPPAPEKKKPLITGEAEEGESFSDLFSDMDSEVEFLDAESGPVAALAGFDSPTKTKQKQPAEPDPVRIARKKLAMTAPVEIDAGFIKEEKESGAFDEELFQIFLQQLQENLSQLRFLTDRYPETPNKSKLVELCSGLVDKLQSSAHYMGYERLAEYHLQWIAELELAGVELSLGNEINFDFMDEKIKKIAGLFPEVDDIAADGAVMQQMVEEIQKAVPTVKETVLEPEHGEFKDFFETVSEHEEKILADDDIHEAPGAIAEESPAEESAPADQAESPSAAAPAEESASEDDYLEELNRQTAPALETAAMDQPEETDDEDFLFGEFEEGEEETFEFDAEPIAAMSEGDIAPEDEPLQPSKRPQKEEEIEDLFHDMETPEESSSTAIGATEEQAVAEEEEDLFKDFRIDEEEFDISSPSIAALAEEEPPEEEPFAAAGETALKKPTESKVDDLEALFGEEVEDFSGDEGDEEEPAFTAEEEEQPEPAPARMELFQKLSHALKSLDEETGAEAETDGELEGPQADSDLYDKLIGALERTDEDDNGTAGKPIDQVIEEILGGEVAPVPGAQSSGATPIRFNAPDIRQALGLDPGLIDNLLNRVGELVSNRSSLSKLHAEMDTLQHSLTDKEGLDPAKLEVLKELTARLGNANAALGRVSDRIRDGIMKVRLTPISHLFDLYEQTLPDLIHDTGKHIQFTTEGGETEIDHCTIEDIASCLLILVRNSIEHGIESQEHREASGKDAKAVISLKAYQERNHVILEVTDDGRGIDPKKIKAVALARDMYSGDDLYKMSDNELTRLIMTPGFSTTSETDTTDHGPGMDQVKDIVEKLKGSVHIKTSVGQGTTIRISIPLALPIFKVLQFTDSTGTYALPLSSVEEVVRVKGDALSTRSDGCRTLSYRQDVIPVLSMASLLDSSELTGEEKPAYVIVVASDSGRAGLAVSSIIGMKDVNIKPLAEFIRTSSGFSGAAIEGENDISFIPDVAGMMESALQQEMSIDADGTA